MVKDTLNSMLDNIKERTTNPFLGTFVIVWIVKNWKLIYSLFYFDSAFKLEARLKYIEHYFNEKSFWLNMFEVIVFTMLALIITYILLALSRLLTEFYDKSVVSTIAKLTSKSSVVLKVKYNELEEAFKLLEQRYEDERIAKINAQQERDQVEMKLAEALKSRLDNDSQNGEKNTFERVAAKLKKEFSVSEVNTFFGLLKDGTYFKDGNLLVALMLRESIIERNVRDDLSNAKAYKLTDYGDRFLKYWNNNATDI